MENHKKFKAMQKITEFATMQLVIKNYSLYFDERKKKMIKKIP